MTEQHFKSLSIETRESLVVALNVILDECIYLNEAIDKQLINDKLMEIFITKRDHLTRAGQWIEHKLSSKED